MDAYQTSAQRRPAVLKGAVALASYHGGHPPVPMRVERLLQEEPVPV